MDRSPSGACRVGGWSRRERFDPQAADGAEVLDVGGDEGEAVLDSGGADQGVGQAHPLEVAKPVPLSAEDDRRLRILSKRKRIEARVRMRARIVLLAGDGLSDKDIASKLDTDRRVAARWRARFLAAAVDGLLQDATRPERPRTARKVANVANVVRITLEQPPKAATHWSTRSLAAHLGMP